MATIQLGGLTVTKNSYQRARKLVEARTEGGKKSNTDVLNALRYMMPGWNISTSCKNWGEGLRNIEIDDETLRRMAEDPEEMIKFKALILDLEEKVPELEAWKAETGKSFEFGLMFNENGECRALGLFRTLLGNNIKTTFELSENQSTWGDLIREKMEAMLEGKKVEEADGSNSWIG